MGWLCPNCRQALDPDSLVCLKGHQFGENDGVLVLLAESFGPQLHQFTQTVKKFRAAENKRLLAESLYEELPFSLAARGNFEWQVRAHDVTNILNLLGERNNQRILDVGAWNGWLSHQLAARGHQVTAIDYFIDEYDGLGAKKRYSTTWQAIQMDLTDLTILPQNYDVVIINHGLQFFSKPMAHVMAAQQKVAPGGILVLLGLQIFQNPRTRIKKVTKLQQTYREHYDAEIFLKPTKGYLDWNDKARLEAAGIGLYPYSQLWLPNLKSIFIKTVPRHYYGVYVQGEYHAC